MAYRNIEERRAYKRKWRQENRERELAQRARLRDATFREATRAAYQQRVVEFTATLEASVTCRGCGRDYSRTPSQRARGELRCSPCLKRGPSKQKAARARVHFAVVKGELKRNVCEVCGSPDVQGHHADYDKPLDVQWLCRVHHELLHHPLPEVRDLTMEVS